MWWRGLCMSSFDVAGLSHCEELYKVTGWSQTTCWWNIFKDYDNGLPHILADTYRHQTTDKHVPAYDLGYLIRRLPDYCVMGDESDEDRGFQLRLDPFGGGWIAEYPFGDWPQAVSDRPEDAVCALAIELFKQGVLSREPML